MITKNIATLKINKLSKAQFDKTKKAGNLADDELYITPVIRDIDTGTVNGTISVDVEGTATDVAVKGLGSAAYTDSNAYDTAGAAAEAAAAALTDAKTYTNNQLTARVGSTTVSTQISNAVKNKANNNHNHDDLYAKISHAHDEYAGSDHTHDDYIDSSSIDAYVSDAETRIMNNVAIEFSSFGDNFAYADHDHDADYAEKSHGTHVSYGEGATAVGATASAGIASTVSRSDHTHSLDKTAVTTALGYTPPKTNTTYDEATTATAGLMSAADKTKLNGITAGANAYSHPTTSGNKHIPSGGSSGQILRWSADGTAVWGADNNTTYSAATQAAEGLMSAADKTKLDGINTKAVVNVSPVDSSGYSTTIPGTLSRCFTDSGLVIISDQVLLTTTASITAGTEIKIATISNYLPWNSVPVYVYALSDDSRRFMGLLTKDGDVIVRSSTNIPAGTDKLRIYYQSAYIAKGYF